MMIWEIRLDAWSHDSGMPVHITLDYTSNKGLVELLKTRWQNKINELVAEGRLLLRGVDVDAWGIYTTEADDWTDDQMERSIREKLRWEWVN